MNKFSLYENKGLLSSKSLRVFLPFCISRTILWTRSPLSQKTKTKFGVTKFTNHPPVGTHKISRTDWPPQLWVRPGSLGHVFSHLSQLPSVGLATRGHQAVAACPSSPLIMCPGICVLASFSLLKWNLISLSLLNSFLAVPEHSEKPSLFYLQGYSEIYNQKIL